MRDDGFMQPESPRRLAQRLHEGDFEPVVAVVDRVVAFLAEQGLERVLVLTARQGPDDLHLVLTGGLTEEARLLDLAGPLAKALDADVRVYPTRDRDVALQVDPHRPHSEDGTSRSPGESQLLVAVGAPASRHTLYANWRALGNVLVAGSTDGGVDTLLASLLAALISRRSPNELQVRLITDRRRIPQGLVGLPHQVGEIVDPTDRDAVSAELVAVRREVLTRVESAAARSSQAAPPELVLVVSELAALDIDPAFLETISLSGQEHGVRLLFGTTRALEIERRTLAHFNTRLVLRVETEDESVELVGWDEAAGLAGGGDMLLWLAGRATVRLRAFRNEPERLDQLGRLMQETYGARLGDDDPPKPRDDEGGDQQPLGDAPTEQEVLALLDDVALWQEETSVADQNATYSAPDSQAEPVKERSDSVATPIATLERLPRLVEEQAPPVAETITEEYSGGPLVRLNCFGPFTVTASGRPLSWECSVNGENSAFHKEWELLAFVAAHGSQGVPAEKVAAAVWPKSPPHSVLQNSLRPVASRLRTLLQHQVEGIEGNRVLSVKKGACRLNASLIWSDAHEFLYLTEATDIDRQAALERAVALFRGDLFVDSTWAWVHERPINETLTPHERFRQAYYDSASELADMYLAQGRPERAIPLYKRMLEFDPTLDEPFLKLVECRKRTGQRSELERDGRRVRERIREEMYDPEDPDDNRDDYDLDPEARVAWEQALTEMDGFDSAS
jgi:DNA-binding SARP family transcriptional activator